MTGSNQPIGTWEALAVAADEGDLFLDPEAASASDLACVEYIAKLRARQSDAKGLASAGLWGDFESGKALERIYAEKAVGGENNMVDVLQSHIDVVEQMRTVFRKFFVDTTATDDGNASAFGGPK